MDFKNVLRWVTCIFFGITTASYADSNIKNIKIPIFPPSFGSSAGIDSPAIKIGNLVFISGQGTGSINHSDDIEVQIAEAFKKLEMITNEAGGNLDDIVKVTVYLADMTDYSILNKVMSQYFTKPYPSRSTVGVSMLPKQHRIEVDAIMNASQ